MTRTIALAPVRRSLLVKVRPEHAFKVFTSYSWWPKEHSLFRGNPKQKSVVIEPRVGGRWYEKGEDGRECDWGKVLAWEPPGRLLLAWQINGKFEYDPSAATEVEITFAPEASGMTRVNLEHRYFERFGETGAALRAGVDDPAGWSGLLKLFVGAAEA
ncbi:MAG TPA: SRPBCC family protein [Alphaproteobacteria bacterium]|nr:SRPBCC family protein [Alphaproteobacteria bacterium]